MNEIKEDLVMELSPIEITVNISWEDRKKTSIFFKEHDFLFFEWFIIEVVPNYAEYGHWGYTVISKEQWSEIFEKISCAIELYHKNSLELFECSVHQNSNSLAKIFSEQKNISYFLENIENVKRWIFEQFNISNCVCIYGV